MRYIILLLLFLYNCSIVFSAPISTSSNGGVGVETDPLSVKISNNGSDFNNIATTRANILGTSSTPLYGTPTMYLTGDITGTSTGSGAIAATVVATSLPNLTAGNAQALTGQIFTGTDTFRLVAGSGKDNQLIASNGGSNTCNAGTSTIRLDSCEYLYLKDTGSNSCTTGANGVTETTLYTGTLTANTINENGVVRFELYFDLSVDTGTKTLRMYWNGSTTASLVNSATAAGTNTSGFFSPTIDNMGSTTQQLWKSGATAMTALQTSNPSQVGSRIMNMMNSTIDTGFKITGQLGTTTFSNGYISMRLFKMWVTNYQ